jgi:hypothetical protein
VIFQIVAVFKIALEIYLTPSKSLLTVQFLLPSPEERGKDELPNAMV